MSSRSENQAAEERRIFERFLAAYPWFAVEVEAWSQPEEWPDVEATLRGGKIVPIELGEWIHGEQLAKALRTGLPVGGVHDPAVALEPLERIVEKKLDHYGPSARGAWLIIHYGRALLYNVTRPSAGWPSETSRMWLAGCSSRCAAARSISSRSTC